MAEPTASMGLPASEVMDRYRNSQFLRSRFLAGFWGDWFCLGFWGVFVVFCFVLFLFFFFLTGYLLKVYYYNRYQK